MASNYFGRKLNFIIFLISIVIGVAILEATIRLLNMHEPLIWTPHPELGWEHIPGARGHWTKEGDGLISINSLGYRDRTRTLDKAADTLRVAVFGDSQTEAVQVNLEETFTYLLEERLSKQARPVEVLNFGVNGYSPIQELLLLKKELPRYRPDVVVIAVFLDNDVSGSIPELNVSTSGAPFLRTTSPSKLEFDYSQAQASYDDFYREPAHTLRQFFGLYRFMYALKQKWATRTNRHENSNYIPNRYKLYAQPQQANWLHAWSVFERTLLELRNASEYKGVPFLIVSIPAGQVTNVAAWNRIQEKYPAMKELAWDIDLPEIRLKKFTQQHGISLVQPYERFRESSNEKPLFFGAVGHLTARGHLMIADALEQEIRIKLDVTNP